MPNVDTFEFKFLWKIENFSMGMRFRTDPLFSPPFTVPLVNASWKIEVYRNFDCDKHIAIYLRRESPDDPNYPWRYNTLLSVLDLNGEKEAYTSVYAGTVRRYNYWGSRKFICWYYLLANKSLILPKDVLTIECEIHIIDYPNIDNLKDVSSVIRYLCDRENMDLYRIQNIKNAEENDSNSEIFDSTKFQTAKHEVLHKRFDHKYGDKDNTSVVKSHDTNFLKTVWMGLLKRPYGVPTKWLFRSGLNVMGTSFTWYIQEFSNLKPRKELLSPAFRCEESEWKLMVYLSKVDDGREIIEIFVCPMSLRVASKTTIKCRISVLTKDGRMPLSEEHMHLYDNDGPWRFPNFFQPETLRKNKALYLANDVLCLYCNFSISDGKYGYVNSISWKESAFNWDYNKSFGLFQLSADMLLLFGRGQFSDVTLKAGDLEIPAHISILSNRSQKFERMIYAEKGGVIEINDIGGKTLKKLMKLIYGGILDLDEDVISAAHKYEVSISKASQIAWFDEFGWFFETEEK